MDKLAGGSIALAFIYFAIVYLGAFVVKKLKPIHIPIIKKGFFLSVVKNSGIFVSLGGFFLFGFSYWGKTIQPLGVVGGILVCLIGLSLGIIGKISEDFYEVSIKK
ncbi:MAG: hypothetical protein FD156_952 [Nitrospirae bacterium]|nr:MAG: hypothetical protein FD156_952 [Nitrospirota bacterium]